MVRIQQIENLFEKLENSVNKCGTDTTRNVSDLKSTYWTYYYRNNIDNSELIEYTRRVDNLIDKFESNCRCDLYKINR